MGPDVGRQMFDEVVSVFTIHLSDTYGGCCKICWRFERLGIGFRRKVNSDENGEGIKGYRRLKGSVTILGLGQRLANYYCCYLHPINFFRFGLDWIWFLDLRHSRDRDI